MTEDFYNVDGVRVPDPTLGKNVLRIREQATVEPVPASPDTGNGARTHAGSQAGTDAARQAPKLPPRRERVVLADPRQQSNTLRARVELEEQTSWGELLIKDLVKAQFRTGILLALLVLVVFCALPTAFFLSPSFASLRVIGVPLPWLLLGIMPFPLLFLLGLWYNRLAERHERDFVDMIDN